MGTAPDVIQPKLTAKGQQTRQRIVEAAARLVLERTVAGTTIEAVQAAAQVSASQLYHYFGDKDALVRAVIDLQTDNIVGAQEHAHLDSLEKFRQWRDFLVALQRQRNCQGGCPIGSLGGQLAETDPLARRKLAAGFARWEVAIRDGLRAMQSRGELVSDADPDHLALATLAALQGGLLLAQVRRNPEPLEAALDAVIALIAAAAHPARPTSPAAHSK